MLSFSTTKANPASDFVRGFLYPFRAAGLIRAHRALRRWSIAIAAITALLVLAWLVVVFRYSGDVLDFAWSRPAEGFLLAVWYVAAVLVGLLLFTLGLVTIPTVATAPLTDPLSVATEAAIGAPRAAEGGVGRMIVETLHATGKAVLRISILIFGHALLLPLWLFPGAGQAIWTVLSLVWTLLWLVFEHLDVPANRRGYRFRELAGIVRRNLALCYGFAAAVHLLLWIPLLNVAFIPLAIVGSTVLFAELRAEGRILPAASELAPSPE